MSKPSENAKKIMDFLVCLCDYIPEGESLSDLQDIYRIASEEGKGKYTAVMIMVEDPLVQWLDLIKKSSLKNGESPLIHHMSMLKSPMVNPFDWFGDKFYKAGLSHDSDAEILYKMEYESYDENKSEILMKKAGEIILAKIPTNKPWEVFAWMPFGGYSPAPAIMMSVSKYWYEKYKATPLIIGSDTVEFSAYTIIDKIDALALAWEHYLLSNSKADSMKSVPEIANNLMNSNIWYFNWHNR